MPSPPHGLQFHLTSFYFRLLEPSWPQQQCPPWFKQCFLWSNFSLSGNCFGLDHWSFIGKDLFSARDWSSVTNHVCSTSGVPRSFQCRLVLYSHSPLPCRVPSPPKFPPQVFYPLGVCSEPGLLRGDGQPLARNLSASHLDYFTLLCCP